MILYYAPGAGLGHLTRAKAVIQALQLTEGNVIVVSQNEFLYEVFAHTECVLLRIPSGVFYDPQLLGEFLNKLIVEKNIHTLIADTFLQGIRGEFYFIRKKISVFWIARIVKQEFLPISLPENCTLKKILMVERLPEYQINFIQGLQTEIQSLSLIFNYNKGRQLPDDYALVVHSGPMSEVNQLVEYALEVNINLNLSCKLYVVSIHETDAYANVEWRKTLHADEYFQEAKFIVTGCGFNSMLQLKSFSHKHYFIPFPRKFDDQFARAAFYKENR